jgi:ferric enterobactin receptor
MDLAFSKEILKGKGTFTCNVIDVFNSRYMRTITEGITFYTESTMGMRARQINLTVNYRLNQAAGTKKQKSLLGGDEG